TQSGRWIHFRREHGRTGYFLSFNGRTAKDGRGHHESGSECFRRACFFPREQRRICILVDETAEGAKAHGRSDDRPATSQVGGRARHDDVSSESATDNNKWTVHNERLSDDAAKRQLERYL